MFDNKTISRIFFLAAVMGLVSSFMFFKDNDVYQGIFYIVMAILDTFIGLMYKKKANKE